MSVAKVTTLDEKKIMTSLLCQLRIDDDDEALSLMTRVIRELSEQSHHQESSSQLSSWLF